MISTLFIVNSKLVHNYIWQTINTIHEQINDANIYIYIENDIIEQDFSFSPIIKIIDSRFNNYKDNAFLKINIEDKIDAYKNVNIQENINKLTTVDWIITEYSNFNVDSYLKLSKNGILSFDISLEKIAKNLNSKYIVLNILHKYSIKNDFDVIYQEYLKREYGLFNSLNKLSFYYSVYLSKFIKNFEKTQNLEKLNISKDNFSNKILFIKISFYYIKLALKVFGRKIYSKKLDWKLIIQQNDKNILIEQPAKSFWADPFIIKNGNEYVIFFEELKKQSDGLGRISCLSLDKNFKVIENKVILDKNYHFSFPNVFRHDNQYYMIPETSQNNTLQLYKCNNFPYQWDFEMNLMEDIKLLDAIWIYHDNLYWLFANKVEDFEHDNNERLYLFYSKNLLSNKWTPHKQNPIVTDASLARNAGNIFEKNNIMYRVSQKCLNGYGENLVINQIKELSKDIYIEQKLDEITPPKGFKGMHTMNTTDTGITVFDVLK